MLTNFAEAIEDLKTDIIKMASIVDEMVDNAFSSIENKTAEDVNSMKFMDRQVDKYDNLIKAKCENIFALYQPVATDLRFIITTLMINNQLERCGDIAVNISKRIGKINNQKKLFIESEIINMGRQARSMVKDAIDSFINKDTELARSIGEKDKVVDTHNKSIFEFLVNKMNSDTTLIEPASHMLILSKHIERLADHATNIAEEVIFLTDAEIVAHKKKLAES
jgi:phosphate transport system protein